MPLTDTAIRKAKPADKPRKMFDEKGLFLYITTAGGKSFRFKYRIGKREKLLVLGRYPDVSLAEARAKRDEARKLVAAGIDPSQEKRAARGAADETFEVIAREWFEKKETGWVPSYSRTVLGRMEQHLFPFVGNRPIREITGPELLTVLRRLEARGTKETARRVRTIFGQVACYAIACGKADSDVSRDLRAALAPVQTRHMAAIIDPAEVGGLLRAIDAYEGAGVVVKSALRLAPLLFVRPGELREAEWSEINFMKSQWEIPAERMKGNAPLIVPLSSQAVRILRELYPVTSHDRFVFPSHRGGGRPMSNNAVLSALRRMKIGKEKMSGHGFRALARTLLAEELSFPEHLIEAQLGHAVRDANGRAYNRTTFLGERAAMMQQWADYLDSLKTQDSGIGRGDSGPLQSLA